MRHFLYPLIVPCALTAPLIVVSLNADALIIRDTYIVNRQLAYDTPEGKVFDLTQAGYSPVTDSITHIKLAYDFLELSSPYNLGDQDDIHDPSDDDVYENEFAVFSSWIFGWREFYGDIDTGPVIFETDWAHRGWCQFPEIIDPTDEENELCELNIDTKGTMNAFVTSYTNNLWLSSITVEIDVDRQSRVVESDSWLMFSIGLLFIGGRRKIFKNV